MNKIRRSEAEVFEDLAVLARSPGYVHAIAQICYRDVAMFFVGQMEASDLQRSFSRERLIRTEITTILGLLARGPIDASVPEVRIRDEYLERADLLMEELHEAMSRPAFDQMIAAAKAGIADSDIWRGEAMREPIFYGSESAYSFQYRDFALEKYRSDDSWLEKNMGFSISQAQAAARGMCEIISKKMELAFEEMKRSGKEPVSWLSVFEQTADEIAFHTGLSGEKVQAFLDAFTLSSDNAQFQSLGDFNAVNARPLLNLGNGKVLLFLPYSIYESLYESPFYWMGGDQTYEPAAAKHRGEFTESFAARRLATVFGSQRIHPNVDLVRGKSVVGEIDVLVVFGNRLIIVQAKSKKLTLAARRGNDGQLRKDFAAAIQDSYDQAWLCAEAILAGDCVLKDAQKVNIELLQVPKEIFIFNLVAEHYPALAFQARQFLKYKTSDRIRAPFVMDVFLLDALTEMLDTPLRLLSYVRQRVENIERLTMSHELTALGFHLKRNLWIEEDFNMVMLDDDISAELDLAMMVRRDNIPGARTPDGILTRFVGTPFERLLSQINGQPDPASMEIGFNLLTLGEDTCRNINRGLDLIAQKTRADGEPHDFSIGDDSGGITFHCNSSLGEFAKQKLGRHCERRKYALRAPRWFGLSLDPDVRLQLGVVLDFEWQHSDEMDAATAGMPKSIPASSLKRLARDAGRQKVGRNDRCPCGSGRKFKKCCLDR
ncbi:SEC-C metal-binding domain-containing protein [Dyella sp. KULCS107]|uniref:SEC-C metal-binding domain-containing protein n=1 Tax=Dyella sp. KULCS107 TaxID=3422216 RepID=UPI003D6DE27A